MRRSGFGLGWSESNHTGRLHLNKRSCIVTNLIGIQRFTRESIVSCHGMVREMTKDTRIEGTSVILMQRSVKAQTGRRYFNFLFLLFHFHFLPCLVLLLVRSRFSLFLLHFLVFFFGLFVWFSSHTWSHSFHLFLRNYAFSSEFPSFCPFIFVSLRASFFYSSWCIVVIGQWGYSTGFS